jgi:hypothetical protein
VHLLNTQKPSFPAWKHYPLKLCNKQWSLFRYITILSSIRHTETCCGYYKTGSKILFWNPVTDHPVTCFFQFLLYCSKNFVICGICSLIISSAVLDLKIYQTVLCIYMFFKDMENKTVEMCNLVANYNFQKE